MGVNLYSKDRIFSVFLSLKRDVRRIAEIPINKAVLMFLKCVWKCVLCFLFHGICFHRSISARKKKTRVKVMVFHSFEIQIVLTLLQEERRKKIYTFSS